MNIDKNYVTADYRQFLHEQRENYPMLQYSIVLPDGATLKRFQKESESYDDLKQWLEEAQYLISLQ